MFQIGDIVTEAGVNTGNKYQITEVCLKEERVFVRRPNTSQQLPGSYYWRLFRLVNKISKGHPLTTIFKDNVSELST